MTNSSNEKNPLPPNDKRLKAEERLQRFLETAPDAMIIVNERGEIVIVNTQTEKLFDFARADLLGQPVEILVPGRFQQRHRKHRAAYSAEPRLRPMGVGMELYGRRRDGSEFPVEISLSPFEDETGLFISAAIRDITDRKQVENDLKALNETLERRVADRTHDLEEQRTAALNMMAAADAARHQAEQANRELEQEIARRKRAEEEQERLLLREQQARAAAEAAAAHMAFLFQATDTMLEHASDYASCLRELAHIAVPTIADWCSIDVIRDDQSLHRLAIVHSDPGKVEIAYELARRYPPNPDATSGVPHVLRTGQPVLNSEVSEATLADVAKDDHHRRLLQELGLTSTIIVPLEANDRIIGAMTLVTSESGRRYTEADLALARDLARRARLVIDNARLLREAQDLNETLEKHVNELARSNEELEQFAYVASHDLQEPLRKVINFAQLLESRYRGQLDEKADTFIDYIVDGASRMKGLISDLLTYSRVGTRGRSFQPTDCNLVLETVLDDLELAIQETHAVVTHDPLPTVTADETQVMQLFQNLIANALKFRGDDPPRIHIGAERSGATWRFHVQDNGIGIEETYADRIFVIFQRLHSRAEYSGTGIGLAICKKIIERHGGRIWFSSEPGKGTTFYFTLPPA